MVPEGCSAGGARLDVAVRGHLSHAQGACPAARAGKARAAVGSSGRFRARRTIVNAIWSVMARAGSSPHRGRASRPWQRASPAGVSRASRAS
eukprot:5312402-Prymnesium_polylepis.2